MAASLADVAGGAELVRRHEPVGPIGPMPCDPTTGRKWRTYRRPALRPVVAPEGKRIGEWRVRYRKRVRINGRKVARVVR